MEYQKVINLLDNTLNQQSKCRTKKLIETNDGSLGTYNANEIVKRK